MVDFKNKNVLVKFKKRKSRQIVFRFPCFSLHNDCARLPVRNQIIQVNWYLGQSNFNLNLNLN